MFKNKCERCGFLWCKMNNDLISREALKNHIIDIFDEEVKHDKKWAMGLKYSLKIIDLAPTVEAYPFEQVQELVKLNQQFAQEIENLKRPQGEWIDYDNTFYKCPDCGYLLEKCCPQCQNKVILPKGGVSYLHQDSITKSDTQL